MKHHISIPEDLLHFGDRRKILFYISISIGSLIFAYYGFNHWQREHLLASSVTFAYAVTGALAFVWVYAGKSLRLAQTAILGLLLLLFCAILVEGELRSETPVWIMTFPFLAFFYKGRKEGLRWLAAFVVGLVLAAALKSGYLVQSSFPMLGFIVVIACVLTISIYIYVYDGIRTGAEQALKSHSLSLDEANRKLIEEVAERQEVQKALLERTRELSIVNQQMSETVDELARLNGDKNELISMIAHDLRSPLAGALRLAKLLEGQEDLNVDAHREQISEVKRTLQYTLKLINHFLNLKSMEAGRHVLELLPHDLSAIVGDVVKSYSSRAHEKNISLECQCEPVQVRCDVAAASEIVENLVSNALKFSEVGSQVRVTVLRRDQFAVIKVIDRGPGFTDEDKQNLFKMFTRLSARPTAGEDSIGLGLSTTKKLTEMMNGRIYCESEQGKGASFFVEIPAIDSNP